MKTTAWCVLLSLLFAIMPAWPQDLPGQHRPLVDFGAGSGDLNVDPLPLPPTCPEAVEFSENPEEFRWQLVDLFHEIETGLTVIMSHPVLRAQRDACAPAVELELGEEMELLLVGASTEEIDQIRIALRQVPELAAVPTMLESAFAQLPVQGTAVNDTSPCSGAELSEVYAWKTGAKALAIAAAILMGVYDALSPWADPLTHAYISGASAAAAVIATLATVASLALEIVADWSEFSYESKQNCLANQCVMSTVNLERRGRGCDGIDQDCRSGPDDCMEDRSAPRVTLRRTVESQCYPTLSAAELAVYRHSSTSDDCGEAELDYPEGTLPADSCNAMIPITATDECDNVSTAIETVVTIDDTPPLIECAVAVESLHPATNNFVDVGLSYTASDGCDGNPSIELEVTSDEPTATAYGAAAGTHQAPDAHVMRLGDGQFQLLLRAERSSSPHGDGRVYRARVHATDRCGNSSFADCLIFVSITSPSTQAINSGQVFDATAVN